MQKVVTLAMSCLLLVGIAIQQFVTHDRAGRYGAPYLNEVVPPALDGWLVLDLPLEKTDARVENVISYLNCEAYVYREYSRDSSKFNVYIAYWKAGQTAAQSVASHSPEHCWVLNGWNCAQWKDQVLLTGGGGREVPGSWRRFVSPESQVTHVQYWHIVDGRIHNYGHRERTIAYGINWMRDGSRQLLSGLPEQHFVRIASPQPLESFVNDKGFLEILRRVAALVQGY